MTQVNGDEVVVHQGDQVVTLEERLASMQRSIRRVTIVLVVWIVLQVLWAMLGPEEFARLIRQVLEAAT
jgi:hypothetical protein